MENVYKYMTRCCFQIIQGSARVSEKILLFPPPSLRSGLLGILHALIATVSRFLASSKENNSLNQQNTRID